MRIACLVVLAPLAAYAAPAISFQAPNAFGVPQGAVGQVAVDFNGDGIVDLAAGGSGVVSILLGKGNGTFQTAVTYPLPGQASSAMLAADFNGDGKLDLAISYCPLNTNCDSGGGIAILLGNGDGSFQSALTTTVGTSGPASMAAADFNDDGKTDLAVSNAQGTVWLLLGKGNGTFQPPLTIYSQPRALIYSIASADFNTDHRADLAILQAPAPDQSAISGVLVLLGNGNGTFQKPKATSFQKPYGKFVIGDFNGDGIPDFAATQQVGSITHPEAIVSTWLGKGDGTFQINDQIGSPPNPILAVGYFHNSGHLDLVLGQLHDVSIFPGNGDGTFALPMVSAESVTPFLMAVGDFNGDGNADLAIEGGGDSIGILLGDGQGHLQAPGSVPTDVTPTAFAIADFNGDGALDIAATGTLTGDRTGETQVFLGNGKGAFTPVANSNIGLWGNTIGSIASADFNGDGQPDLVLVPSLYAGSGVAVMLGNGDGSFQNPTSYALPVSGAMVAVADFNGDGKLDLVVTPLYVIDSPNANVFILLGNGDGTFQPAIAVQVAENPQSIAVGDFNHDGTPDLAVVVVTPKSQAGQLAILLSNGDGTFGAPTMYAAGPAPVYVAAADLNHDGNRDLVVTNNSLLTTFEGYIGETSIAVLLGKGDGTFGEAASYPAGTGTALAAVIADFNGDVKPDVAVAGDMLTVLMGNGDGSFAAPLAYALAENTAVPAGLATGSFSTGGKPDLLEGGFGHAFSILANN